MAIQYVPRTPEPRNPPLAAERATNQFPHMLTGSQIRAARALLKWSASDLAERCGVSYAAVQRAETAEGLPNMQTKNLAAIKSALETAGVVFLDPGESRPGGPGVRLR